MLNTSRICSLLNLTTSLWYAQYQDHRVVEEETDLKEEMSCLKLY